MLAHLQTSYTVGESTSHTKSAEQKTKKPRFEFKDQTSSSPNNNNLLNYCNRELEKILDGSKSTEKKPKNSLSQFTLLKSRNFYSQGPTNSHSHQLIPLLKRAPEGPQKRDGQDCSAPGSLSFFSQHSEYF